MSPESFPTPEQEVSTPSIEAVDESIEETETATRLTPSELALLTDYVKNGTDRDVGAQAYFSGIRAMDALSKRDEEESGFGRLAVATATLGALSRNPVAFNQTVGSLLQTSQPDLGMPTAHINTLVQMNRDNMAPGADRVGQTLQNGLSFLENRQKQFGEDITRSRIAMLTSSFAATRDESLRSVIVAELRK